MISVSNRNGKRKKKQTKIGKEPVFVLVNKSKNKNVFQNNVINIELTLSNIELILINIEPI